MGKLTLRERLVRYLTKHGGWVASGELQRIVSEHTTYTPQTTGRELRLLHEANTLEVKYGEKNHAYYRINRNTGYADTLEGMEKWFNDLPAVPVDTSLPAYRATVIDNAGKHGFRKHKVPK